MTNVADTPTRNEATVPFRWRAREHPIVLRGNALGALATIVAVIIAILALPDSLYPWAHWTFGFTGVVLLIFVLIYPFLQWLTSWYTLTERSFIAQTGFIKKNVTEFNLEAIEDVRVDGVNDERAGTYTLFFTTHGFSWTFRRAPQVDSVVSQLQAGI